MLHQMMEAIGVPLDDSSRYNGKVIKIDTNGTGRDGRNAE